MSLKTNTKTKRNTKKKRKKITSKELENEFLLLAFLLAAVSILGTSLKNYTFPLMGYNITFSIFILPAILFISNYITKKMNFNYSFKAIIISTLIIVAFILLIDDLVGKQISGMEIISQSLAQFVCLFVNLAIYYYVVSNIEIKKESILIYFSYIFSMVINHIIYMLFSTNMVITEDFWATYFIAIIIEAILSIVFVFIDSKIKRGIE